MNEAGTGYSGTPGWRVIACTHTPNTSTSQLPSQLPGRFCYSEMMRNRKGARRPSRSTMRLALSVRKAEVRLALGRDS